MTIAELIEQAHTNAVAKGFWQTENVGEKLALIATEIMEFEDAVTDAARSEELADIVIRVFDLCGYLGYELSETVLLPRIGVDTDARAFAHKAYRHVARATQAHRKGDERGTRSWLSSLVVHCAMYSGTQFYARKLQEEIEKKMEKNRGRPTRHGARY